VVLVGAVHEARPALDALLATPLAEVVLVVTAEGSPPSGRVPSGLVDLGTPARAAGVPVLRTADVNAPEEVAAIRATRPDLLVVVGWTRLIGEPLLAVPRRGCIGFHASLLPRHRGRAPVNWAILRGERETGNTMMLLAPGVDSGDIVDQRSIPIGPEDTCAEVYERVGRAGAEMLVAHLPGLLAGTAPRRPQPRYAGALLPKRTPDMGVIDWRRSAYELHDWVRALTAPYPGAFTSIRGRRVMVWRTRPPALSADSAPGVVLAVGDDGVRVGTGCGELVITEMGGAGEQPQPAGSWCARAGIVAGNSFDAIAPGLARWALGLEPRPREVRA
jgi:methionyl-tRNA formyltransferase